jgi:WD40 repeat protein
MVTISGPVRQNGRFPASEIPRPLTTGCRRSCSTLSILAISGLLLACGVQHFLASPSVEFASNRQALLVTSTNQTPPAQLTLQNLPTESTIAPGLFFHPQRFDQVRLSPDGQRVAFSTVDHHALVGLLDLATMAVREIGVITEGEVVAFHWSVDGRTLAYDYLPASGYRRVKAYDIQSGETLVVPRSEGGSAVHVRFEQWGSQSREITLSVTDIRSNERQTDTIKLIPHK